MYPEEDFNYSFFDEYHRKILRCGATYFKSFKDGPTGLAVFISCLGLLGLVIYTTNQRTKEIGVKKSAWEHPLRRSYQ
jgi:hypothetical protein